METKVSATVPSNQIQGIISQIQERENLISQKILEIEFIHKTTKNLLIFAFFIIFLLIILNFYFLFKWRKVFPFSKISGGKKEKQKKQKVEKESISSQIYCKIKNCPFFREKKPCLLFEFGEKLSNFTQIIFQNRKNDFLKAKILEISKSFSKNCYFEEFFDRKKFELLKRNLKKIRYFLNKIKRERKISAKIKNEAKILWNFDHKLSQKISNFLKSHSRLFF